MDDSKKLIETLAGVESLKYDFMKTMAQLLPSDSVLKVAETYTHGTAKYIEENWRKGRGWKTILGGLQRHVTAWSLGEDIIPDQGTLHLAAAAWCCLTLIYFQMHGIGTDDRHKSPRIDPLFQMEPGNYEHLDWQEKMYAAIFTEFKRMKDNGENMGDEDLVKANLNKIHDAFRASKPGIKEVSNA